MASELGGPLLTSSVAVNMAVFQNSQRGADARSAPNQTARSDVPAVPAHVYKAYITQHPQVLGYGRLLQAQACDDSSDRSLLQGKIVENLSPAGLGHRIEGIGRGGSTGHPKK